LVKTQKAAVQLTLMAVMSALVIVGTMIVQIPNAIGGYFNVGDVMIFVSALTFNPLIGGVAGGLGSALADMLSGYLVFAPATFVIKGLEGFLAGFIADKKSLYRDVLAVVIAGSVMVTGYFLAEIFLLGMGQAIAEILPNIAQVSVGGLVGVPVALILRRQLPELFKD
jgi:uncharacterized membrane protein